jgi:hypothetical protein
LVSVKHIIKPWGENGKGRGAEKAYGKHDKEKNKKQIIVA